MASQSKIFELENKILEAIQTMSQLRECLHQEILQTGKGCYLANVDAWGTVGVNVERLQKHCREFSGRLIDARQNPS